MTLTLTPRPPLPLAGEGEIDTPLPQAGEGQGVRVSRRPPRPQSLEVKARRRELRNERATEVEKKLWWALRNRQLGVKFRRQHPVGPYFADFACIEAGLIVELDGGQHADALAYDEKRSRYLESQGFRVLRFWNNDVTDNIEGVLETIVAALATHPHPPAPSPACGRGGEGQIPSPACGRGGEGTSE